MRIHLASIIFFIALSTNAQSILNRVASFPSHSDSTFILSREALREATATNDSNSIALAHFYLGKYFFDGSGFEQAVDHFLDAERFAESTGNIALLAQIKAHLGTTHHSTGDRQLSLIHLNEALESFQYTGDSAGIADVYGRLGHYFEKEGDYATALAFQTKALRLLLPRHDTLAIAVVYENFGSIYEDLLDLEKAKEYFEKSLQLLKKSNDYYRLANVYNNLGDVHRKAGQQELSMLYTRMALRIAQTNGSPMLVKSANRDLAKAHSELGHFDSAFYYLEIAYIALDSIFGQEVARQMALSKVVYDTEKKEAMLAVQTAEIEFLEKEKRLGKMIQYTFGTAFIVLLALSIVLFRLQRIKMLNSKLIYEQKEKIYQAEEDLNQQKLNNAKLTESKLKTELENKRLREIYLNEQLELRSNELTSQTLKIIRKNTLLNEISEKISQEQKSGKSKDLQKLIDRHLRVDKNWESFQELFEKVHGDFYQKLIHKAPDLSPAEIRLACLLKLNLPSKDIAAMLGISPDSLRIARYRLRKKLQLNASEKLSTYMIAL